ncbi:MAG TPA: VWA domain-containing protein [Bryobacteraceae bacterium]|nr:VWA domain-containing protein [Bryobacteraceae bacterium]
MYCRAAIAVLFLRAVLSAVPQAQPPDAAAGPVVLKSASHAVQLDVFVSDSSGHPVHGLQKSNFVVTDNGRPRDIRIFSGEVDTNQPAPSSTATVPTSQVYSNRLGMRDSRIVTAIVLDAVTRPEGLQRNPGMQFGRGTESWFTWVRWQAISAIIRMQPGQTMAVYAACPELRIVQDYTSDPGRLLASLRAFQPLPAPKKEPQTIEDLVPPTLQALRNVAGRMSGASGRKSVVWISQAYGSELFPSAFNDVTNITIDAFNDANVPLYAVDTRFNPSCENPADFSGDGSGRRGTVLQICSQPPDISDRWMEYLARATGGRAFSGGYVEGVRTYDAQGRFVEGRYSIQRDRSLVEDAIAFAMENSRYSYELGFYLPESELDGKVHKLDVTVPGKPRYVLRYRSGYTASATAPAMPAAQETAAPPETRQETAGPLNPVEVGIDATGYAVKNELRVSLALAPDTVTRTADGGIMLDATFTQMDLSGKELAKVEETVRVPAPATQTDMVRYARTLKLTNRASLLHIGIRDQATNRAGSLTIPIGKQ